MQDTTCCVRQRGGGTLGLSLPFTASEVLPKGSARGRISGSRSAVSGDLSPSISFSGLKQEKEESNRERKANRRDNVNQVLRVQCGSLKEDLHSAVGKYTITER